MKKRRARRSNKLAYLWFDDVTRVAHEETKNRGADEEASCQRKFATR